MIYLSYVVLAAIVVFFSIKAADYVDLIDKKTNISGAFIGGVMLAAITSLPEFFTSLSGALILKNSELVLGNILGSNIFNLAALTFVLLLFMKKFVNSTVSSNHNKTTIFGLIITTILFLPIYLNKDVNIINISIISIVIIALYFISLKFMASDTTETEENNAEDNCTLTIKQICIRFALVSIGLVVASILITYVTEEISDKLNLAKSLSGALFLGIATSLPEVSSIIALAKKGKFDLVVGNIVGSNIFNLFIIAFIDILYIGPSMYITDAKATKLLWLFVLISTILTVILLTIKNLNKKNNIKVDNGVDNIKVDKTSNKSLLIIYSILSIAVVSMYILYLILSI